MALLEGFRRDSEAVPTKTITQSNTSSTRSLFIPAAAPPALPAAAAISLYKSDRNEVNARKNLSSLDSGTE